MSAFIAVYIAVLITCGGLLAYSFGASDADASEGKNQKVVICHATSSEKNPYSKIEIDASSIDNEKNTYLNGHGDHSEDIIPPFTYENSSFNGSNWDDAGVTIWKNECNIPTSTPTPTPTPSPTSTDTPTPTPSPSMIPSYSPTATPTAMPTVSPTYPVAPPSYVPSAPEPTYFSPSPNATSAPEPTPSYTYTPTPSPTFSVRPTIKPTPMPTPTPTAVNGGGGGSLKVTSR